MRFIFPLLVLASVLAGGAHQLPWMGVSLQPVNGKQGLEVELSEGVGFEVSEVVPGGPLDQAGGKAGDIWWKFDGQILVNKGQIVVLLRRKAPGDEVRVDFYRDGKAESLDLKLGKRERRRGTPVAFHDERRKEERILAKREKVARVEIGGHNLSLEAEGMDWRFLIRQDGTTVLSALVSEDDFEEKIPARWHQSFVVLRQTLGDRMAPPGAPAKKRVRYIPRPESSGE